MDHAEVLRRAQDKGWTVTPKNNGHLAVTSPDGSATVTASASPSDRFAGQHLAADLKRAGLDVRTADDPRRPDRVARGVGSRLIRDHMRNHPERSFTAQELLTYVRATVPDYADNSPLSLLANWCEKNLVHRTDAGCYRWGPNPARREFEQSRTGTAVPLSAEPLSPKLTGGILTGDATIDADLQELDEALAALGRIEAVVRRNRGILKQIADFKKLLGGA